MGLPLLLPSSDPLRQLRQFDPALRGRLGHQLRLMVRLDPSHQLLRLDQLHPMVQLLRLLRLVRLLRSILLLPFRLEDQPNLDCHLARQLPANQLAREVPFHQWHPAVLSVLQNPAIRGGLESQPVQMDQSPLAVH